MHKTRLALSFQAPPRLDLAYFKGATTMMTATKRLRRSLDEDGDDPHEGEADRSYNDVNMTDSEWQPSHAQDDACTMPCHNEGSCGFGRAIHGFAAELLEDQDKLSFPAYNTSMHCVCPTGWTGLHCEIKLRKCPPTEHCFNGKKCQLSEDDYGKPFRHCECDANQTDFSLPYTAHFCGQTATVYCASGIVSSSQSFCKNGGKCLDVLKDAQQA